MSRVTPFVGVWIETPNALVYGVGTGSHPSWVCGLKLLSVTERRQSLCHTLRGCVD